MRYLPLIILILTTTLFLTSCDKEVDIIVPVEDLSNTSIVSVTIINIPPYFWDNGSSPDLYLTLSLVSDSTITYITNQVNNVEQVPQILNFPQRIPMSNSTWHLQLLDQDDLNTHDVIYDILFNPHVSASNGKIPIIIDGVLLMEFNYVKS